MTHFISGHLDLTQAEFDANYRPAIDEALARSDSFIVGDARGTDAMAQNYLLGKTTSTIVYHMFASPRNNAGFKTMGGFETDEARRLERLACLEASPGAAKPAQARLLCRKAGIGSPFCANDPRF
jgi:hypothetical protein